MKATVLEIADKLRNDEITYEEARMLLLDELYNINEHMLTQRGLTIKYVEYGLWQLRQNGEYIMEGEKLACNNKALEIIKKYNLATW